MLPYTMDSFFHALAISQYNDASFSKTIRYFTMQQLKDHDMDMESIPRVVADLLEIHLIIHEPGMIHRCGDPSNPHVTLLHEDAYVLA
jgi:hypothetical protein